VDRELIGRVLAGDDPSRDILFRLVEQRVRAYLNRVTLNREQAADWTQDTILSVLAGLPDLRDVDRFWSWVFTIATNKARQQMRRQSRHGTKPMSVLSDSEMPLMASTADEGSGRTSREELAQLTRTAMEKLDARHRMVLSLRFYEDLPHSEIAKVLGCSEMGARAVFFRAKRAMTRELKQLGVAKGALAAALAAFGEATLSPSASAGTVTLSAAAVTETAIAVLLPVRLRVAVGVAVLLLIIGGFYATRPKSASPSGPAQYIHFTEHALVAQSDDVPFPGTRSRGAYEQWIKLPEGANGPMLTRMQRWEPRMKGKLCWWVQNADANYYVHSGKREIYIQNARLFRGNLETRLLPTDPEPFCEFVRKMDGEVRFNGMETTRDPKTGHLSTRQDLRFPELGPFETVYEYSAFGDELFEAPSGMTIKDERDAIHRRGWAFFRIQGTLKEHSIDGTGRLPLMYGTLKSHGPWLKLNMDGQPVAIDKGDEAFLLAGGQDGKRLSGGALFRGMSRPWLGFHTIDTIRRDAAGERLRYEMTVLKDGKHAEITVTDDGRPIWEMAVFLIQLERDLVEKVWYRRARPGVFEEAVGELSFTYLENVDGTAGEFAAPKTIPPTTGEAQAGMLWPLRLLEQGNPEVPVQASAPADR